MQLSDAASTLTTLAKGNNGTLLSVLSARILGEFAAMNNHNDPNQVLLHPPMPASRRAADRQEQVYDKEKRHELCRRLSQLLNDTASGVAAPPVTAFDEFRSSGLAFVGGWRLGLRGGGVGDWTTSDPGSEAPSSWARSKTKGKKVAGQGKTGGVTGGTGLIGSMLSGMKAGLKSVDVPAVAPGKRVEREGAEEGESLLFETCSGEEDHSGDDSEEVWGPGMGQIPTCITDHWDEDYGPELAERWKTTSYHDDVEVRGGYENEYFHANMTLKKFDFLTLSFLKAWNTMRPNCSTPMEPGELYHPRANPLKMRYRPQEQVHNISQSSIIIHEFSCSPLFYSPFSSHAFISLVPVHPAPQPRGGISSRSDASQGSRKQPGFRAYLRWHQNQVDFMPFSCQVDLEQFEEQRMKLERKGMAKERNRTRDRWSFQLWETCDNVTIDLDDVDEQGAFVCNVTAALEAIENGADLEISMVSLPQFHMHRTQNYRS